MLPDLIRHAFTLQMEIVAMVAEEIQQRAESYVQTHSDEAYEAFLNQIIDGVEKTIDLVAAPVEAVMQQIQGLRPQTDPPSGLTLNWNEALETLQSRIQDLRKNLQA
ncbi:MAG TPA: hypothetical protein V6D23_02945 [Candidatus Obscuribacterales bacterium]